MLSEVDCKLKQDDAIPLKFSPFLGHFYGHFEVFLMMFWEVDCKMKQNDAREGKPMEFSAKIHQKYAKLCNHFDPF